LNVTVPVGVPPLPDVTVAVNVTGWLNTDGFGEDVAVVDVALRFWTDCTVLPLLAAKIESEA
jgi:hypothetical protein